jgi:hypothetical protein
VSHPRIGIIGSCVTRDLWPITGPASERLCYIDRTSLPSLLAKAPSILRPQDAPPPGLAPHQHRALKADIEKTALETLIDFRPTHLIFDFIDERFDLLRRDEALITRSWELLVSEYLGQAPADAFNRIPRLSEGCDRLWRLAVRELAALVDTTPLRDAAIILHASRWAYAYRDADGVTQPLPAEVNVLFGEMAAITDHNQRLDLYDTWFQQAFPRAGVVRSEALVADEAHRWGLAPFHYIPAYYEDIRGQLADLGVS